MRWDEIVSTIISYYYIMLLASKDIRSLKTSAMG